MAKTKEIQVTMSRKLTTNVRYEDVFFSHGEVVTLEDGDDYNAVVNATKDRVSQRVYEQEQKIQANLKDAAEKTLREI